MAGKYALTDTYVHICSSSISKSLDTHNQSQECLILLT